MIRGKGPILERLDPVCGGKVNPEKTKHTSHVGEEVYYFCSTECRARFESDPEKYAANNDNGRYE